MNFDDESSTGSPSKRNGDIPRKRILNDWKLIADFLLKEDNDVFRYLLFFTLNRRSWQRINNDLYKELSQLSKIIKEKNKSSVSLNSASSNLSEYERDEIRKNAISKFKMLVKNIMREQKFIVSKFGIEYDLSYLVIISNTFWI